MTKQLIDGTKVSLGGALYLLPALNFRQIKALKPQLEALSQPAESQEAFMDNAAVVVQAALSRNYPDVTLDAVADMLDLNNSQEAVKAIMGQSGLVQSGEEAGMAAPAL